MPRIRLILEDDNGTPLLDHAERIYLLEGRCDTLNQIEEAVEKFKNAALPDVEQTLLDDAQQRFTTQEKKESRALNGKRPVCIKTRHGAFDFLEQTFQEPTGQASAYLGLSGQKAVSVGYGRRQATGKPIGSGRMEKAVDQVIGMRQKKKGMSWSKQGSRALAALKIAELNGQWQQLFELPNAA